jgi:TonB family protein
MGFVAPEERLFSLLPEKRPPWKQFAFSTGTQAVVVALLLWIPVFHPEIITPPEHTFRSVELVPTPPPVNHQPQRVRELPKPLLEAKVDPPPAEALHLPAPQPKPRVKVEDDPAPTVAIAAKKLEPLPEVKPEIPKRVVRMDTFSTGSSAEPTIVRPASQVQTGGFGDPNGIPAKANQTRAVNIASSGSFDLPSGPGYGNGTGGAKGARGVIASSGFGNGTAISDAHPSAQRTAVQQGGFGDADVPAAPTVRSQSAPASAKIVPAEILSKPTPAYTEEARHLKIEGEVLLEVVLEASGRIRVVRVVRGLGHGLDDNAVKAAEQIHFKPAMKDGQPSDSTAVLHIIFQLA